MAGCPRFRAAFFAALTWENHMPGLYQPGSVCDCSHSGGVHLGVRWAAMKTINLIAVFVLLAGSCASQEKSSSGSFTDGNTLLDYCIETEKSTSDPEFYKAIMCSGYVDAAIDATAIPNVQTNYCFPAGVKRRQIYAVVLKYLRDHPEQLHLNGVVLVHKAIESAFPCGR